MPVWPMAIPSQTPMQGKATGLPPASLTPAFTASTMRLIPTCPGIISLVESTMPIIGMSNSRSVQPSAFISDR